MAEDGVEGVQMAKFHYPDLILCDVNMPTINGIEVLKQLRNDLGTSHIPFFFLTSEVSINSTIMQRLGATGVILKDARIDELRRVLTTLEAKELM